MDRIRHSGDPGTWSVHRRGGTEGYEDQQEKVCSLDGIGLPEVSPDTHDLAEWDWCKPEEYVDLGHMKPSEVPGADDDSLPGPHRCMGTNKEGDRCGTLIYQPDMDYCDVHSDQASA